jgi:hypothetical protein
MRYAFWAWVALCGLLAPAAARAQAPTALPVPPVPGVPAPTNGASSSAASSSYNEPVEAETIPTVTGVQSPGGAPVSGMPFGPDAEMGQWRSRFWQPFVGVETIFLAPIHNTGGGGANYTFSDPTATSSYTAGSGNGMVVTPRIWMGLMGQRWGVGVRYWGFANDPGGGQFPNNPTSEGVFSQGVLKLQTFDFDVIRRFQFDDHQIWFTVGLRQAEFARNSTVSASDVFNHGLYSASASASTRFSGFGLTTSLYGVSPIGASNWNVFYGGRVSYLGACYSSAFADASASYVNNHAAAWISPAGSYGYGDAFIGELQIGVQYNHALQRLPATAFFRIGGEFQYWHVNNDCSASGYANAGPVNNSALVAATASAGNSNLALLGFGISAGLAW